MTIRQRYHHLTFWNKIAFWGSIASIISLALVFLPLGKEKPTVSLSQQAGHNNTQIGHVSGDVIFNQEIEHTKADRTAKKEDIFGVNFITVMNIK